MSKLFSVCMLAVPLLSGCAASSEAMGEIGYAQLPRPRPGYALVVFVRPSGFAAGDLYHVFSDRYGFLGDAQAETWFSAEIPAGQHVFCASGGGVSALRASQAPGRSYFVEVSSRYGFWGSRVHLVAIAPRFDNWASREQWLSENEAYVLVDRAAVDHDNIASVIGECQKRLGDYSSDELDQRTLGPGDGL